MTPAQTPPPLDMARPRPCADPAAAGRRGGLANAGKRALPLHAPCCPHECDVSLLMGFCPRAPAPSRGAADAA